MSKAQATDKSNKKNGSADTTPPTDTIPYDQAVAEGKKILADAERGQWRLGELAHNVEKGYGERKLAKFAEAIGVAPCTLLRYRDVYRAWKDICAPGRKSISDIPYSVLRELAGHKEREKIIHKDPNITKREAREEVRSLRALRKRSSSRSKRTSGLGTIADGSTTLSQLPTRPRVWLERWTWMMTNNWTSYCQQSIRVR